jgi:hypothetical protein
MTDPANAAAARFLCWKGHSAWPAFRGYYAILEERHLIDGKTAKADQRRWVGLATLRSCRRLLAVLEKSLSASGVTDGKDGAPDL